MSEEKKENVLMGLQIPNEMKEALRKDAEANFRTIGMHLLWILKQHLKEIEVDTTKRGY